MAEFVVKINGKWTGEVLEAENLAAAYALAQDTTEYDFSGFLGRPMNGADDLVVVPLDRPDVPTIQVF